VASVAQIPGDRQYIVGLASSFTAYQTYPLAYVPAVVLSAANSSTPVYIGDVLFTIKNGVPTPNLIAGAPQNYIIQLSTTAVYYPLATATAQAYVVSAANSNAIVWVARCFQSAVGP
jgi:hypothetical protein